jgi:hypothetical protein
MPLNEEGYQRRVPAAHCVTLKLPYWTTPESSSAFSELTFQTRPNSLIIRVVMNVGRYSPILPSFDRMSRSLQLSGRTLKLINPPRVVSFIRARRNSDETYHALPSHYRSERTIYVS